MVYLCLFFFGLWLTSKSTAFIKSLLWQLHPLFIFLDNLQWTLAEPLRILLKDYTKPWPRYIYFASMPLRILYLPLLYLTLFPVRVLSALYFDLLLFAIHALDNEMKELLNPESPFYRKQLKQSYRWKWIGGFPLRFIIHIYRITCLIIHTLSSTGISIVFPTVTVFHGTQKLNTAAKFYPSKSHRPIIQSGHFYVGEGDWAGRGIYFSNRTTAQYYAGSGQVLIMTRLSPGLIRPIASLPQNLRHIGTHNNGKEITEMLQNSLWKVTELWRKDRGGWYELCLLAPSNQFIRSWRMRPLILFKHGHMHRVWRGYYRFPNSLWEGLISIYSLGVVLLLLNLIFGGLN